MKSGVSPALFLHMVARIDIIMKYELRDSDGETSLVIAASTDELALPQFLAETEMVSAARSTILL